MFPPEIIDHVLSFLQWDCATLKICAEAHPSLSKLVERHMYAHLTIHKAIKRIVDDPIIANHVRTLHIYFFVDDSDYGALASILPRLTQLQTIFLHSLAGRSVGWQNLSESFRTAFTQCLRLPTLTDVKVSDIADFPLSVLDHSNSLKRLFLLGDFDLPCVPCESDLVYLPLDSLVVFHCPSTSVRLMTSWVKSRSFRSLEFNGDLTEFPPLLELSANILTTLHIHVPPDYKRRYGLFNSKTSTPVPFLASLPHLARLTIQASIFPQYGNNPAGHTHDSCLPAIMGLLETLPSPPTNLVLLVITIEVCTGTNLHIPDTDWSPLLSFPYFDVIPNTELRVRAYSWTIQIPFVAVLNTLKEDPHLMELEKRYSFVVNVVN